MVTDWAFLCHSPSFLLGTGACSFVIWWGKQCEPLAGGMRRLVEREGGGGFKGEKLSHDQNCKLCFFLAFICTNLRSHSGVIWSPKEGECYYDWLKMLASAYLFPSHQDVPTMEACRDLCLTAPYRCYSFDYADTGDRVCRYVPIGNVFKIE